MSQVAGEVVLKVVVACEFSGIVRDAFLEEGHDAISIDILPTESPGPHFQGDMLDYDYSDVDLLIAHPPCTYLCVSGNRWHSGSEKRMEAGRLIEKIWKLPVEKVCIENPVGVINSLLTYMPRPQYIQPWQFGHGEVKKTGLWKRNLPDLRPTCVVEERYPRIWKTIWGKPDTWKDRSRTYTGIAKAMAEQWGKYLPDGRIEVGLY